MPELQLADGHFKNINIKLLITAHLYLRFKKIQRHNYYFTYAWVTLSELIKHVSIQFLYDKKMKLRHTFLAVLLYCKTTKSLLRKISNTERK